MSARKRAALAFDVILVPLLCLTAIVLLWEHAVGWLDLAIMGAMYVLVGLGITLGFHRLHTHRAYRTHRPISIALAALGQMALQGSVIEWVADHRKHHAHADVEGDPHSPHGEDGVLAGLWHAHVGWLFLAQGQAEKERYAPDLIEDRGLVAVERAFLACVALSFAIPFALGLGLGGSLEAGLSALLWGGLVRIFLFQHAIFAINSVGHFFGHRRFETDDCSTNVFWLAPVTLGESWHNNHHAFPRSASPTLRWWEFDPTGSVIRAMERLGLAWDVRGIA
ncbi:MAG: acyl-CoA desaturase [Solirubrobacterales bacterium]